MEHTAELKSVNPYKNWTVDDENRIVVFDTKRIGGEITPFLDKQSLDKLASYFIASAETVSTEAIDLASSVELIARNGLFVDLAYKKEQKLQGVIILKDGYAENWNPIALELAKGLAVRDIPTMYGEFYGSLDNIQLIENKDVLTSKGNIFSYAKERQLLDLAHYKQNHIILVFSNGQNLIASREEENLSVLSKWPKVAWLELREPRNWDSGTRLPMEFNLPVYPANAESLVKILSQFFIKQQPLESYQLNSNQRRIPSYIGKQVDEQGNVDEDYAYYLERFLGDSISWARACAMIQPLSLALADKLRRTFFAGLPLQRLERLINLPNTSDTVGGLIFSQPVQKALRYGFKNYFGTERQEAILRFVLKEMEAANVKPLEKVDGKYTLAYLNWKAMYELLRVNIDSEREVAKKQLQLLLETPLGNFVKRECKSSCISL